MTLILDTLKQLTETRGDEVEAWFARARGNAAPYLYNSVDLRHSGQRLVPVDTNLYPAGFHNLSPRGRMRASRFARRLLVEKYPDARRVLIVPENHTRNLAYLDNLLALQQIFADSGVEVEIGSLAAPAGNVLSLTTASGKSVTEHPVARNADRLALENGFTPDLIVLNNDLTPGVPDILKGLSQPVLPPVHMGWWQRKKSTHFAAYESLVADFSAQFSLDPWLLSAGFHACGQINFKEHTGLDCLAKGVEKVLSRAREKHREYGISEEPYVYIKADSGTYGMGIMTAHSPEEVLSLNKKTRNKMQVIKEGAEVSDVIIQEGIPTIDTVDGKPSEPMVYMVDGIPVGGMYRVNGSRDAQNNLNAAGMEFTGMCDEAEDDCGQWKSVQDCHFRAYGIIAAIAALAVAREKY